MNLLGIIINYLATYINKELKYSSELGEFFLAKNPNYAINAKSPLIVVILKLILLFFCFVFCFLVVRESVHDFYLIHLIKIFN